MALNKVTYQDLDTMLSDGWRILMQLGRDANGVVLLMQRRPDLDPELLEVTDGFFLGSINHKLLSTTHTDTTPTSPINDASAIIASDGLGSWIELDVPAGLVNQILAGTQGVPTQWLSLASLLPGATFLEASNETLAAATVPNVDTTLKTITLGATLKGGTSNGIVAAEGYITFGALSTNQSILFKLKRNGTTIGSTLFLDAALGAVSRIGFNIRRIGQIAANDVFTLTISAAAADANTTVSAIHMEVSSVL